MTKEELRKKLQELGFEEGSWKTFEAKEIEVNFEPQKEILRQLKSLVEAELEKKRELLAKLHVMKQKIEHGGGS